MNRIMSLVLLGAGFVISALPLAAEQVPVNPNGGIPGFAHYMDWAVETPECWAPSAQMPRDYPNGYASIDKEVIAAQNVQMEASGVMPMISWWARDTYAGDEFLDTYLEVPGPQIGILYEAVGPGRMQPVGSSALGQAMPELFDSPATFSLRSMARPNHIGLAATAMPGDIDMGDPINADIFISDMQHLQEKYFSKYPDRFFTIDGRPVVFIWISHAFVGPFDQVVARARQNASFYLIGSDFTSPFAIRSGRESVIRAMDAISAYGFFDTQRYNSQMNLQFLADYRQAVPLWHQYLAQNSPHTKLLLPMGFSYDERKLPNRHGLYFTSSYAMAQQFAELVRWLIDHPCDSDTRVLRAWYITSWSEFFEGSAIAPSDLYGDSYANIISRTFNGPSPVGARVGCATQ